MCTNYAPVQRQILREIFGVEPPPAEWKPETWPDYAAPIVRMDGDGRRDSVLASFGLVPRSRVPQGVRPYDTMNARSETVGEKRTFSGPGKKGQLCLIPVTAVSTNPTRKPGRSRHGTRSGCLVSRPLALPASGETGQTGLTPSPF
ncbi:SOS response-associated peptidase family protein [Cupriavidus alkaliphilus]|uniref:SOS response-associated peptidase family protein n=1 Tax=Cupriavidus alkaliphilus TaxID=942866 RepID=UPI0035D3FDFE